VEESGIEVARETLGLIMPSLGWPKIDSISSSRRIRADRDYGFPAVCISISVFRPVEVDISAILS